MTIVDDEHDGDLQLRVGLHRLAAAVEREHPDWPLDRLAREVRRRMSAAERESYLLLLLREQLGGVRRARVREIEKHAEDVARRAENTERKAAWEREQQERRASWEREPWTAPRNSRAWKTWTRTTPEGQAHAARLESEREAEARRRAEIDAVGVDVWYFREMERIMGNFRDAVRLELTAELLGAEFALGDGRSVTWGAATVAEHTQRIDLLMGNVRGNLETANRHRSAVAMIAEHGVSTLNDVVALERAA